MLPLAPPREAMEARHRQRRTPMVCHGNWGPSCARRRSRFALAGRLWSDRGPDYTKKKGTNRRATEFEIADLSVVSFMEFLQGALRAERSTSTQVPALWNERGSAPLHESEMSGGVEADAPRLCQLMRLTERLRSMGLGSSFCLAISWLSPSSVIGRHRTISTAGEPRKGTISNDDDP